MIATNKKVERPQAPGTSTREIREHYAEFRELLLERERQILHSIEFERAGIAEQQASNFGTPGDVGDASVMDTSADYFMRLADHDRRELLEIHDALNRMQRGIYGVCESCESPIAVKRLRNLPFARRCIECQSSLEDRENVAKPLHTPKL